MLDRWICRALLCGVAGSLLSIFVSDLFYGAALCLWLVDSGRRRAVHLKSPPFTPLVLAFAGTVLLSVLFSSDPLESAIYLRKFVKFIYIFLLFTYFDRGWTVRTLKSVFLVLGASSLYGIAQYYWLMEVDLLNRIQGFMGHWMTFSGQLMLGSVALTGCLLFGDGPPGAPAEAAQGSRPAVRLRSPAAWLLLGIFLFALLLTHTRGTWIGTVGALALMLWIYRVRWMVSGLLLLLLLFLVLPGPFKQRLYSGFDATDTTTRIRLELLHTGANIVAAHPWWGLGPRMVPRLYGDYNETDEFPRWIYQHLHNNPVHIAAEMGLVTLAVWLALWGRVLWDLSVMTRRFGTGTPGRALALSGIGVVVAFLLGGLFEYNFGDSEILILLLFFVTVPYVADRERKTAA